MIDSVALFFGDLIKNIRFADLIDIAIVSFFLYTFINWFRKSASRRLLIAVTIFVVVYLLARIFGLYLTEMLIKIVIGVILIAAIMLFQSDIRRLIDLFGTWGGIRGQKRTGILNSTVDVITSACTKMAENHTGALIAIRGREIWDNCINGGIELDGRLSQPLIFSIFNTKSPGHDGAILVEDNRIIKFGAHLTLSTNLKEIGPGGTRHAAALGLSEKCDALVIAVSEERGTISVAEDGRLSLLTSSSELKERIERFWERNYQKKQETAAKWWKSKSLQTALVAVFLSVTFWALFANQSDKVYRSYTVPIEFRNLRPDLALEDPVPMEGRVTLAGSEQAFRLFNPSNLIISINMERLEKGDNEIMVARDNLELPSGVDLYRVEPRVLKLKADAMKLVRVPVRVQTMGSASGNVRFVKLNAEPSSVMLRVPDNSYSVPKYVSTEPIDLSDVRESSAIPSRLIPPKKTRLLPEQSPEIMVKVQVPKK
ncbi:MAG TPA: diadenylate cyclase [Ignavibacteriales bacterium]|nr:diadenylate cyclase [Ignavibacteriales bacterium]